MTKIVLPKVLQSLYCPCWPRELNQKGFPRNIQYRTRPKGPLSVFFWLSETSFFFGCCRREVLLLFLNLRYGADLGRSRLGFEYCNVCFSGVLLVKTKLKDNLRMLRSDIHSNLNLALENKLPLADVSFPRLQKPQSLSLSHYPTV